MDFTLDYMALTLDFTEIHASDWSEGQLAQSREITLRGILIGGILTWGRFDCTSRGIIRLLAPLLQNILEFTEPIMVLF